MASNVEEKQTAADHADLDAALPAQSIGLQTDILHTNESTGTQTHGVFEKSKCSQTQPHLFAKNKGLSTSFCSYMNTSMYYKI